MAIEKQLVVKGGTICVGGHYFGPGKHWLSDVDDLDIKEVTDLASGLPWLAVLDRERADDEDRDAAKEHAALRDALGAEPPEKALPVPGERDVAANVYDEDEATKASRLAEKLEADRAPKPEPEPAPKCEDCDKEFKTAQNLAKHRELKHGESDGTFSAS